MGAALQKTKSPLALVRLEQGFSPSQGERVTFLSYTLLRWSLTAVFLVAGVDKFFNVLTDWSLYTQPFFPWILGLSPAQFMEVVGVMEVGFALGLAVAPLYFSGPVTLWLLLIVLNILSLGTFLDVALREFVLAIAVFALGPLAQRFQTNRMPMAA